MNCVNHPDRNATAYCQHCGRALCAECTRPVGGVIYCEQCLAAKLSGAPQPAAGGAYTGAAPGTPFAAANYVPGQPAMPGTVHPVLAAVLGFIPGVGAFYNGQFLKGIAHLIIFATLTSIAGHLEPLTGLLLLGWIFYQVFDAYQTAQARMLGMPLPNPLGLNDLGKMLGIKEPVVGSAPFGATTTPSGPPPAGFTSGSSYGQSGYAASGYAPSGATSYASAQDSAAYAVPPVPPTGSQPYGSGFDAGYIPPAAQAGYAPVGGATGAPYGVAYDPMNPPPMRPRRIPTGAVILIALGTIFLLGTLNILNESAIRHGWPLILIVIGGWLLYRRLSDVPRGGAR